MDIAGYEVFARAPKTPISPFELNPEGGGGCALVLRYAGCNLRCPLCYAWRYAWFPRRYGYRYGVGDALAALDSLEAEAEARCRGRINWVRVQGGEPLLSLQRTMITLEAAGRALRVIHEKGLNRYGDTRAIIQTNGILFSALSDKYMDAIREKLGSILGALPHGRIIIELSLKDPTGKAVQNGIRLLDAQARGFQRLLEHVFAPLWREGFENTALYMVAGLGPSIDMHNTWIIPIDMFSLPEEHPLFHPTTWSQAFKTLHRLFIEDTVPTHDAYREFRSNERTGGGRKIALEELEPTMFQTSWISGYAGKYGEHGVIVGKDLPEPAMILRRLSMEIDRQWLALFRRNKWIEVLRQIPVAKDPEKLLSRVKEMNRYFYPSHPKGHYPYL